MAVVVVVAVGGAGAGAVGVGGGVAGVVAVGVGGGVAGVVAVGVAVVVVVAVGVGGVVGVGVVVAMTLTDRIAFAERLVRHLRAEYHGLISASLPEQVRPRVWSKDQGEQEAFERGLREGLEIVEKGEGA